MKFNNFDNILINEKPYKHISNYDISYKTLVGSMRINIDEVNVFIRVYDVVGYFMLFDSKQYHVYRIELNILLVKKAALHMFLPINMQGLKLIHMTHYLEKKTLTFYNVRILSKSVFNKDKNNHYYNIFLEKVNIDKTNLIYYDKIDVNKINKSKKFVICHYWYF